MEQERHSIIGNSRNYITQLSESNGAFDANITLAEKVVGRWSPLGTAVTLRRHKHHA